MAAVPLRIILSIFLNVIDLVAPSNLFWIPFERLGPWRDHWEFELRGIIFPFFSHSLLVTDFALKQKGRFKAEQKLVDSSLQ